MVIKTEREQSEKESPIRSNLDIARRQNKKSSNLWTFLLFSLNFFSIFDADNVCWETRVSEIKRRKNISKRNNNVHIGFIYIRQKLCSNWWNEPETNSFNLLRFALVCYQHRDEIFFSWCFSLWRLKIILKLFFSKLIIMFESNLLVKIFLVGGWFNDRPWSKNY